MAFTPIDFMICSWRSMARRLTAAPERAEVVVDADALELDVAAVEEKPLVLSKAIVRMPNGVT